jgi:hypothetical protein
MAKKQITPRRHLISERDLAIDAVGVLSAHLIWISAIFALRRHRRRWGLLQVEGLATNPTDLAPKLPAPKGRFNKGWNGGSREPRLKTQSRRISSETNFDLRANHFVPIC